jgi:23S rRNA (adenine2030-N6)-methyltransferase
VNYRHAFHAGGFGDVVKHALVVRLLEYLKRKPQPIFVLDTHAGIGRYDLRSEEAARTGEAREGILRLLARRDAPPMLATFLDLVRGFGSVGPELVAYPGSPRLIRGLLRRGDRLFAVEKHPEDVESLRREFARDRQTKVFALDGYEALGSFVPPKERRGLVIIDPPFEAAAEFDRLAEALRVATKQWESGVYAIWYPIKYPKAVATFRRRLADMPRVRRALTLEIELAKPDDQALAGCGLAVINPPYVLPHEAGAVMPYLAEVLRRTKPARWRLVWLRQEEASAASD